MSSDAGSVNVALANIATKLGIQPDLIEDVYPCTAIQAALLVADLHGIGSYTSTFVFDLSRTAFKAQDVRNACELVYDHTPILRTRFLQSKSTFLQVVTTAPLSWAEHSSLQAYLDLNHEEDKQLLGKHLAQFAWINESSGDTYLVWTLHHALYDEWSIDLLFEDLSVLASSPGHECRQRPKFSKFVKALAQLNRRRSELFWQRRLACLTLCHPILPFVSVHFETSRQFELSEPVNVALDIHQLSTLAIAAWSVCVSVLSGSDTVTFGNIVNGRTLPIPGLVDICGPTMTTVPYVVSLPWEKTTGTFLDELEHLRSDMLPYEHTGFSEYKRMAGTGRYDTLLSIRSSQTSASKTDECQQLRPNHVGGRQVRHPCLIYLDVVHGTSQCWFKASFDKRHIYDEQVSRILGQLSTCMQAFSSNLDTTLRSFSESIDLSDILQPCKDRMKDDHSNGSAVKLDPKILKQVQEIIQANKAVPNADLVSPNTSLRELGLDSLSTVALTRNLNETFAVGIPLREVTGLRRTVSDIARSVQTLIQGTYEEQRDHLDLMAEATRYSKEFSFKKTVLGVGTKTDIDNSTSSILLTGASGYLGIVILQRLLTATSDRIVLLVRCSSAQGGLDRIRRAAKIARWNDGEIQMLENRVEVWSSDLAAPDLGLDASQLTDLQHVRVIIHNGARVDFSLDYRDLEATNVSATAFLLRHQLNSSQTPTFVYLTGGRGCPLHPEVSLEFTASKLSGGNGYAQTKFTSEALLCRASDVFRNNGRAFNMTIVHPGIIVGNESTGVANTDDFLWRYVAASIQMGAYVPAVPTKREWVNLMSAESVAAEAVSAAVSERTSEKCERRSMRSGLSVARFWEVVIKTIGPERDLKAVSEWEWLQRLQDDLTMRSTEHPLFSLSQMLLQGLLKGIGGLGPRVEDEPSGEEMEMSERAVAANVRYLETVGFFSPGNGDLRVDVFGRSER